MTVGVLPPAMVYWSEWRDEEARRAGAKLISATLDALECIVNGAVARSDFSQLSKPKSQNEEDL